MRAAVPKSGVGPPAWFSIGLRCGAAVSLLPIVALAAGGRGKAYAAARQDRATQAVTPGTLQVTTRLVQVSVIVKDRHGQLVPGLTEEDFRIFDEGVPQGISDFEVEQSQAPPNLPAIPKNVFTNIPERAAGGSPTVTVILLDGLNTRWENQTRATQQVIKFLRQIQPGDRVGIYALGTRLILLHDFTSDSGALVKALEQYRGRPNTEVEASEADNAENPPEWADQVSGEAQDISSPAVAAGIQQWVQSATNLEAEYYMNQRVSMTLEALQAIAQHLRGIPGRKNLVWLSSGFPLLKGLDQLEQSGDFSRGGTYEDQLVQAAEIISDSNLAVYPVDARGLMTDPNFSPAKGVALGTPIGRLQRPRLPTHLTDNFATMDEMARRTGGRAYYNTNDIDGSIRQVIDGTRLTYLLGFYPSNTVWNGKFHKIKVEVDRPGLRLDYRDGYSAVPGLPARTLAVALHEALDAAVLSPLDATGVATVVKATAAKTTAGSGPGFNVQYWINPLDITLARNGEKWAGHVTLIVEEFGPQRQTLKGFSRQFKLDLTGDERKQFLAAGLRYDEQLPVVAGAERLRVVVRDDPTGKLGSVSVPLDRVPPSTPAARN